MNMDVKFLLFALCALLVTSSSFSQTSGSITVHGDFDKFYPVTWQDGNWHNKVPTTLKIGRPDVHENSVWRGSLIASFEYHVTNWGNGANSIKSAMTSNRVYFIAGWMDGSGWNNDNKIIIWLRGGGTTYSYQADAQVMPAVYDNIQNTLPYQETNGPAHSYKVSIDPYVNTSGESFPLTAYFNGDGTNHFKGNLGLGTTDTKGHKLAVAGSVVAESVKVKLQSSWPDYVFNRNYQLMPLPETGEYIQKYGHLPDIPSEDQVKKDGIDIGEINIKLLKKIEELTLHMIQLKHEVDELKAQERGNERFE